jgi:hypothetical protein
MPDELCALPAIDESYAAFMALVALMDGIGCAPPTWTLFTLAYDMI